MRAELIAWVTGEDSSNRTASRFSVHATDLGIPWSASDGTTYLAFGDTYGAGWGGNGAGPSTADWRKNVLARSTTRDLPNLPSGLVIDSMVEDRSGHAGQVLASDPHVREETVIPTAGIEFADRQWMHAMSVRRWLTPGRWTTNYAALWSSSDGNTWQQTGVRWDHPGRWWHRRRRDGSRFQMAAFVHDRKHVLMFGTPAGRFGDAYLARSYDMRSWEYWHGQGWGSDPAAVVPVMLGPIAELSVIYHEPTGRWLSLSLDEHRGAIMMRSALYPAGMWTTGEPVLTRNEMPGLYGGYFLPASTDGKLWFLVSSWPKYNVALFTLSRRGRSTT